MPLHIIRGNAAEVKCDAVVKLVGKSPLFTFGADRYVNIAAEEMQSSKNNEAQDRRTGRVKIKSGGKLPCRYVIKVKAPVLTGEESIDVGALEAFYRSSLETAVGQGCESAGVPLIAAHGCGYSETQLIRTAAEIIGRFLNENEMTVYLCVYSCEKHEPSGELYSNIQRFIAAKFADECTKAFSMSPAPQNIKFHSIPSEEQIEQYDFEPSLSPTLPEASQSAGLSKALNSPRMAAPVQKSGAPSYDSMQAMPPKSASIEEWLKKKDESFAVTLLKLIDRKGMTDVECYKKANVGKKTFWKINNQQDYRPSKQTVIAFAIALELTFDETQQLLRTVGFSLSHSSKADLIIEYFIVHGNYDIFEINEALFSFDELTLGC